jgi:hypothetical protein
VTSASAIRSQLGALLEPRHVYELRIPKAARYRTVSGYFDNVDALAEAATTWDGKAPGVYVTLNPVKPALLARAANRAKPYAETTTSDADVERRLRLLLDFDAVRPSGIASTNTEHEAAIERARRARESLRELGWPDPLLIDSGNGAYLVYALDLANDAAALALVNGALAALAQLFGDDAVKIDQTVGNASRIARIPGSLNAKGDDTPERPHRRARILEAPERLDPVPPERLAELAMLGAAPGPEDGGPPRNGSGRYDLDGFIARHRLEVRREKSLQGTRVLELTVCPFNSEHTGGCAAIFERADGRLGFRCHHDSCNGRGWRALREHLEPAASRPRPSEPAPAKPPPTEEPAQPIDLGRLLDDVRALLERFVVFQRNAQVIAVALWVVHTHVFEHGDVTAYLAITSPEKRSGKSRLLDVLELVVARAWRVVLPSEAVIYRKIAEHAPTLLLDEVDAIYGPKAREHEGLRALLNAGHRRGSKVPRCVGATFKLEEFETYCPKALAGIGKLPDTVADRSISIRLARRKRSERVERFRTRAAAAAAAPLRERLMQWTAAADLREARPEMPDALDDRAQDGWEPLLALADAAGGDWPKRARKAAVELHGEGDPETDSLGVRLLADCREVLHAEDLFTAELVEKLRALDTAPWREIPGKNPKPLDAGALARFLKAYGIKSKNVRRGGREGAQGKGYRREDFADAWERYLSPASASEPSHRPTEQNREQKKEVVVGRLSESDPATANESSHRKPNENTDFGGVGRWDGKNGGDGSWELPPLSDGPLKEEFDALAAHLEYEAGLPRDEAERRAAEELGLLRPARDEGTA